MLKNVESFETINEGPEEISNVPLSDLLFQSPFLHTTALVDGMGGEEVTYKHLFELVKRFGTSLYGLGIRAGDIVGLVCGNSIEQVVSLLGILYIRAVPAPINPTFTAYELKNLLGLSRARYWVLEGQVLGRMLEASESLPGTIEKFILLQKDASTHTYSKDKRIITYQTLIESSLLNDIPKCHVDVTRDVAMLLFSSGTTGLSKAVQLSHRNITFMVLTLAKNLHPSQPAPSKIVVLSFLPLFHIFGVTLSLFLPIFLRSKIILFSRFNPELIFPRIQLYKVNEVAMVPSVMDFMNNNGWLPQKYDLSSLITVFVGGSMCSKECEAKFKRIYNIKNLLQGYGLTECSLAVIFNFPSPSAKLGSAGKVFPHTKATVRCVKTGEKLGANQVGEICVKGHQIMLGYLNNEKATREAFDKDGWFHTGDVGCHDEDGYFFIVDRIKDLIKYHSFQVSPSEIETLLRTHPCVEEAAVIGIRHPLFGEVPKALVVRRKGCEVSQDDIIKLVKGNLAGYKQLRAGVEFVEGLPKNGSGKVLKNVLKQQYNRETLPRSKI